MAAQQLMKKGKQELASLIKAECLAPVGHTLLNVVLDHLLDPHKTLDDCERIEWCRMIIAGGMSFKEFSETVRSYDNATMCGFVWTSDYVAYRCRTCGLSPCMSLCSDCFLASDHVGHDFNMFRSQAGGACDCGDASVMKPIGFCPKHRPEQAQKQSAPHELVVVSEIMMPRLICRLVQHLRDPSALVNQGAYTVLLPETDHYLDFLQQLSDMGAAMRSIITKAFRDIDLYRTLTEGSRGTSGTQLSYETAVRSLRRVPVPDEFRDVVGLDEDLSHSCLLDEIFFWVLKYEFPQKLVTLLLSMLPDEIYKEEFTRTFVKHYAYISTALVKTKDKPRMSNCVVHISVQLLSPVQLATQMVIGQNLLHIMLASLMNMMKEILTEAGIGISEDCNNHVVDCSSAVMRDHSYWPIVSDVINVFSHRDIMEYFLSNKMLIRYWTRLIACFQGMNVNIRELQQHVEYEPEGYYAAFSAELEISASPMWSLLQHLEVESAKAYTKNVIDVFVEQLQHWFSAINAQPFSVPNPRFLSFHLPLHRYLSIFINCAISKQGLAFEELNIASDFLQLLMIHPLQLLVGFHEIYAGLWVRNGLQIRGQAMTYLQCHFCNSTIDADFYILQVIAANLDPDHFIQTVLERFHVLDCLTFQPKSSNRGHSYLLRDQEMPMLEATLSFLSMLLSVRIYSGESSQDVTHKEMVALLCISDRTHSQLMDSIPEKCGLSNQVKDFDLILKKVSEYKEPVFELGGNLQQGRYLPSRSTWIHEYDPLHVLLRCLHRRDFQAAIDRYSEYVKQHNLLKGASNPWPPFRIPSPTHPAYAGLMRLLHCRTMHALIFTLLHKAVFDSNIPDAVVFYSVFLLELAVTIPYPDTKKREILITESHVDKQFSQWFSSSNIFANLGTVIPHVTVTYQRQKDTEKELTMDVASQMSLNMDILNSLTNDPTWAIVSASAADLNNDVASLSPSLLTIQVSPQSANLHDEMEVVSDEDSDDDSTPKFHSQGVNAVLDHEVIIETVAINESIISLLLKLYKKVAGKTSTYVPPPSSAADMPQSDSRVGDGEFFVRKLLDLICRKSRECNQTVISLMSSESGPGSGSSKNDPEESRRKAKQRQERMMKDFASKQKLFMSTVIGSDFDMNRAEEGEAAQQPKFDCCICGQMTTSTESRPIGLTALIQPSSVLGHRRHSPDPVLLHFCDTVPRANNFASEFNKRLSIFKNEFDEASWLMGLNIGWQGGVHAQSCGHYLHLDCHRSYISSLKNVTHQQYQFLQVQAGEFLCPVCRQLSNTVLPIPPEAEMVPTSLSLQGQALAHHVADVLFSTHMNPKESSLTDAMKSVINELTNITYPQYRLCAQGNISSMLMFIGSLLRTNLEMELIQRSGSPCLAPMGSNLAQKKSCILPLFHVLSMHYKMILAKPGTDLWSHITGLVPHQQSMSLSRYAKDVPLLVKDVSALLIQLLLSLPSSLNRAVFQCIVQALYNVQLVQSVVAVSCRLSSTEHEAWKSRGRMANCSGLESVMAQVIEVLSKSTIYDDDFDSQLPAICQNVWSPMSVEESIQEHILPFLRISAQLQRHLYKEDVPLLSSEMPAVPRRLIEIHQKPSLLQKPDKFSCRHQDNQHEFLLLASYLGLAPRPSIADSVASSLSSMDCLKWMCDRPEQLVQAWCRHIVQGLGQRPASYRMLLTANSMWYPSRLLALPKSYDQIFQYYRKKECSKCGQLPKSPALCLVCGQLVCYKQECCNRNGVLESITHSVDCGAGTAIFLIVNSSVIIIVRGPRAAIWGSVYLDKHGEEDRDLKRGKPLHLNEDRFRLLHQLWIMHSFDHVCKQWIVHNDQL